MDSGILRRMQKVRSVLLLDFPFFGHLVLKLELIESKQIPTLMTNGLMITYNPDYVKTLDSETLKAAIVHETLHCVFQHCLRRGHRNHELWNIAGDFVINALIKSQGLSLGKDWCYDKQFDEMTTDQVYNRLLDKAEFIEVEGCGWITDRKNSKKGCSHSPGMGEGMDGKGTPLSPGEIEAAGRRMKQMLAESVAAARMAGTISADLERLVDGILHPKIRWTEYLRQFLDFAANNRYNWTMPNRRHLSRGIYLPSLYNKEVGTVVLMVDTSGSISQKELTTFASEISGMFQDILPEKVIVLSIDFDVCGVDEYSRYELPIKLKAKGGGGTSFKPGFKWLEKHNIDPSCVIYFTDLYGDFPKEPNYPTIWAATSPEMFEKVPFGQIIDVSDLKSED